MTKLAYALLLATLLCGCATTVAPRRPREATDIDDVIDLLEHATTLQMEGELPGKWVVEFTKHEPLVKLPLTVQSRETIQAFADLIRTAEFKVDPEMTQTFRDGTTISTAIHLTITVDARATIYLLAEDMIVCRDMNTYVTRHYTDPDETYFAREVALILKRHVDRLNQGSAQPEN